MRRLFLVRPLPSELTEPFAKLIDPLTNVDAAQFSCHSLPLLLAKHQPAGPFALVSNVAEFKQKLLRHTDGLLDDAFFCQGLYLAGGAVLRWLLADAQGSVGSDYDVFFYGLSEGSIGAPEVSLLQKRGAALGGTCACDTVALCGLGRHPLGHLPHLRAVCEAPVPDSH